MNKIITLALILGSISLFAYKPLDHSDYTYQKEIKVKNIYQLYNQVIVPQEVIEGVNKSDVAAGKVRILIGNDMVAFKGIENLNAFGIISKIKTPYGFELKLIDNRGTDFSKLAIELDSDSYIENIYFESKQYGDFEFRLPLQSTEQIKAENKYYTARNSQKVYAYYDLDGKSLKPYKRINFSDKTKKEEKVAINENLSINFESKNITINSANQSKTLRVKNAKLGVEQVNDYAQKVLQIKTNKRANNMKIYLDEKNQISAIETKLSIMFLK